MTIHLLQTKFNEINTYISNETIGQIMKETNFTEKCSRLTTISQSRLLIWL